ncbi:MAG: MoxR-like ATPase [Candidatus Endobugula sp.]|jgi:MoxR-like ATPase
MSVAVKDIIHALNTSLSRIIYGKTFVTKQALTCLLAGGHLLLEDLPGMGKTTLAQGLAKVFGLDFQRVQFTSDLLPADIIGGSIFQASSGEFIFRKGPLFTQVLLADEINRASPKTQSALLEAMGEQQLTADGHTYTLPSPFFVIATQNPLHQSGTFPLPESQLDRFMMRLSLGYPSVDAERLLLKQGSTQATLNDLSALLTLAQLESLQQLVHRVKVSDSVLDYLQRLLSYTRESSEFSCGLSPRAALAWLHCAKAWAMIHQRDYVIPDDLQVLMLSVVGHRLLPKENLSTVCTAIESLKKHVDVVG